MIVRKAVLAPLLVAAVAGCSGGGAEVVVPPPLPEITGPPTPSASPTLPTVPSAATEGTPQGAAAFVRHFYQQVATALVTLDASSIRAMSAPSCQTCSSITRAVERERTAGNRYTGGRITRFTAEAVQDAPGVMAVTVSYDSKPLVRQATSKAPATVLPGARAAVLEVFVRRVEGRWRIDEVTQVQQ